MGKTLTTSRTRLLAAATGLLVLIGGTVLAAPVGPASASARTIGFAGPGGKTGPFPDGALVQVSVTGFAAGVSVLFAQCPAGVPHDSATACHGADFRTTDSSGKATGYVVVKVGLLDNAARSSCDESHPCEFNVTRQLPSGDMDPSESVAVAIPMSDGSTEVPDPLPGPGALSVSYTPGGVVTAGQEIVVTATGLTPFAPVMLGQCTATRTIRGPGDCAPSGRNGARLTTANADGVARTRLAAIVGPMLNTTPPATVCSSNASCAIVAVNIADVAQTASTPLIISGATVAPTVGVTLSKKSVKKGKATTFKGKVGPNQARQMVKLQRKVGKKWVTVKTARLGMDSRYAVKLRPKSRKDYTWRVLLPKTAFHKAAVSKKRKLKVR